MSFLRADGSFKHGSDKQMQGAWSLWLPSLRQMRDALYFQVGDALGPEIQETQPILPGIHTTMQQGLGMVVGVGVVAGALPFLVNLLRAIMAGTSLQILALAEFATERARFWSLLGFEPVLMSDTFQQIAGMSPRVPGFLAALFSAVGVWVNTPLAFLTLWIAYGAGVLAICHIAGAKTSLQHFFAATAYAFLPLILTTLTPLPWLGGLVSLLALIGFVLLYLRAVRLVTGLESAKVAICVLLPGAIFVSFWLIAAGMLLGVLIV